MVGTCCTLVFYFFIQRTTLRKRTLNEGLYPMWVSLGLKDDLGRIPKWSIGGPEADQIRGKVENLKFQKEQFSEVLENLKDRIGGIAEALSGK